MSKHTRIDHERDFYAGVKKEEHIATSQPHTHNYGVGIAGMPITATYPSTFQQTLTSENPKLSYGSIPHPHPQAGIQNKDNMNTEYIVGNGKTTSFTFPTTDNYPKVRVFSRAVEGEDVEQTVTVTELGDVIVSIVQGENITVEFPEAPARRGAVILIG